jgi:hypothetical protein
MAQGPGPDATSGQATDAERVAPLKWLRYSRERFRTLMRMLAARAARAEAKAAEEAQRAEAKRAADAKAAEEVARRAAEARAAEEAQRAAEAKRAADAKAAEEVARRAAEARAAEEAQRAAEGRRAADAKAAEEVARRAAEAKAAEEAQRAAEAKRAADAKAAPPAAEPARREACANAGARVTGVGWYVVERGDSLWSIARAHYGYGRTWPHIHAANRRTIANPRLIYPCQRIYIPRGGRSEAPQQGLRAALEPFIVRRAIDTALPGFAVD